MDDGNRPSLTELLSCGRQPFYTAQADVQLHEFHSTFALKKKKVDNLIARSHKGLCWARVQDLFSPASYTIHLPLGIPVGPVITLHNSGPESQQQAYL